MSDQPSTHPESDSLSLALRIDQLCLRFEADWKEGRRPRVEDYLEDFPSEDRPSLLCELLELEIALRRQQGEDPTSEEYRARFAGRYPELVGLTAITRLERKGPWGSTPPSAPGLTLEPVAIPGCQVLRELGRGGMGVVYLVRQMHPPRIAALKMLLAGAHAGPELLARFRTETDAVARLQHAHIIQIFEVGQENGRPFMLLEYMEGGSLARKLDGTPWEAEPAARLVQILAEAVHYAHQRGVVHRDLNPNNVLLTTDGQPKVSDFGLAKLLASNEQQTRSGAVLGTPNYMAPEQADGQNQKVGPATDGYALGAILYELLTGRPPFKGATPLDTLLQVVNDEPVAPRRFQPRMPLDLETICLKCLHKEPTRRYASAAQLAEDLRRFRAGEPIEARPTGPLERTLKWARRQPAVAALLSVSLLAALALVGLLVGLTYNTRLQSALAAAEQLRQQADEQRDEAVRQQGLALQSSTEADRHRAEADKQRLVAVAQQTRAEDLEARVRYARDLGLARQAWGLGRVGRVLELLEGQRPQPGREDLRGFEWYHLWDLSHRERLSQAGVERTIVAPNGKTMVTVAQDRTGRLWDTTSGTLRTTFSHRFLGSNDAVYSPDGQTVAVGGTDGTARLCNPDTGKQTAAFRFHPWGVLDLACSPDGRWLATVGNQPGGDGSVMLWKVAERTGKRLPTVHARGVLALRWAPHAALVAAQGGDGTIRLWDAAAGKETITIKDQYVEPRRDRFAFAFTPDGQTLVTRGDPATLKLWDVSTGGEKAILQHASEPVYQVTISPNGKFLAVNHAHHRVTFWDVDTGKLRRDYRPLTNAFVGGVAFSPDSRQVATAEGEAYEFMRFGYVRLWESFTGKSLFAWPVPEDGAWSVAFSPDGKLLAAGANYGSIWVWDLATRNQKTLLQGHGERVMDLEFATNGSTLLLVSRDNVSNVKLWDVLRLPEPDFMYLPPGCAPALSADGGTLVAGGRDGSIRLVDLATRKVTESWRAHPKPLRGVALSGDRRTVASSCLDVQVKLWEAATGKERFSLEGHTAQVTGVAFTPEGTLLASCSWDHTLKLWDVATGKERATLRGHRHQVHCLALSPDGRMLASGGEDQVVKLWEVSTGEEKATLQGHQSGVMGLAFSADGKTLASAGWDGTAILWDLPTGRLRHVLKGHTSRLLTVAFSPDGRTLASAGLDQTIRLWETKTGMERYTLTFHAAKVVGLAFTPDGKTLLSTDDNGVLRFWHADGERKP